MADNGEVRSEALKEAAERRVELKQALSRVETAAAAPSGDEDWRPNLIAGLEELRVALAQHVAEVEASDGLLAELAGLAPRLVNQIVHVRDEHPVLTEQLARTIANTKAGAPIADVRAEVLETLLALASHRQKGADLVYEGYNVDIGGS